MGNYNIPKNRKRSSYSSKRVMIDNPMLRFITVLVVFALGVALAGMIALKLYLMSLPPIKNLNKLKPNIVTTFCAGDGEVIKTFAAYTYSNVSLKEVPDTLVKALIATEDKNFYSHPGYDLIGLGRSMVANLLAGHVVQGASTITQQLSRILFLSNEKTYTRKIKELQVAAQIEKTIDKDELFAIYYMDKIVIECKYSDIKNYKIFYNGSYETKQRLPKTPLKGIKRYSIQIIFTNGEEALIELINYYAPFMLNSKIDYLQFVNTKMINDLATILDQVLRVNKKNKIKQ